MIAWARTRRSSAMATYHSRAVLSRRRRGRGLSRRDFSRLEYPRSFDRTPSAGRLIAAGHQPPGCLLLGSGQRLRRKVEFVGGLVR
jgi:hypothetical protein